MCLAGGVMGGVNYRTNLHVRLSLYVLIAFHLKKKSEVIFRNVVIDIFHTNDGKYLQQPFNSYMVIVLIAFYHHGTTTLNVPNLRNGKYF